MPKILEPPGLHSVDYSYLLESAAVKVLQELFMTSYSALPNPPFSFMSKKMFWVI